MHYRRDQRSSEDTNKKNVPDDNIFKASIVEKVRTVIANPAKVLIVPGLCVGYTMLMGALYINVLMYHTTARRTRRRKSR